MRIQAWGISTRVRGRAPRKKTKRAAIPAQGDGRHASVGTVAEARNVPNLALVIPFSLKLLRAAA
jgi:hypothetical protein